MGNRELSVILPALNEEENIVQALKDTLAALDDFGIDGEAIVVNDGSTDRTAERVHGMIKQDQRIRMITHEAPRGIGASFWDGVTAAAGDVVVMMPGDGENNPAEIFRYFKLLEHVDIVIPFIFNRDVRPWFRNFLSFVYRYIINTTFGVNFNYTNGTILYRKAALNELPYRHGGFFFQTDILIRLVKKGYLFAEVPYRLGVRRHGRSSAVSFPSFLNVTRGYARLVRDYYFCHKGRDRLNFPEATQTAFRKKGPG